VYAPTPGESFEYAGNTYYFCDFGGWMPATLVLPERFVACTQDLRWNLYGTGERNWAFSFEENEGYDSDHDAVSDAAEAEGKLRAASDPQDANSPNRRQAMYFPGPAKPSALQSPPEVREMYPVAREDWPQEMTFMQFTVEAWVYTESLADATVVERAIWCDPSKAGDEEFVRKNFQLGIKNGKWYAKYDANGTLERSCVEALSEAGAKAGEWHHLAATYDGARFILYVDGEEAAPPVESNRQPEYGTSALVLHRSASTSGDTPFGVGDYWYDLEYPLSTIVVGASLKTSNEGGISYAFDVRKAVGWRFYNRFFQGFIDEVRIWDGARVVDDIRADYRARRRYTRETALENRMSFYSDWRKYGNRYGKDSNGDAVSLVPELRYHFSFDSVPGGMDDGVTAKAPAGFDYYQPEMPMLGIAERGAAVLSRPADWSVAWWTNIVAAYGSVYDSEDWVQWVPNTMAHLPRFDGSTLDSFFWSENTCGGTNGTYYFARTAEPASRWTQIYYNGVTRESEYATPGARHHLVRDLDGFASLAGDTTATNRTSSGRFAMFQFMGRYALQDGMDLLPLGGAYAKTCEKMWDGLGPSTAWEITSDDANFNDLPDAWEAYAAGNYAPESSPLDWETIVTWNGRKMTAGEAYRHDLAQGRTVYTNASGDPEIDATPRTELRQTADEDASRTPDWWDDMYGVYGLGGTTDSDNDGLNNYVEYLVSEIFPFGIVLNPKKPMSDSLTNDYFRTVGRLYLGEMFTDHDQMEDHWERARASATIDPNVWDAQRDGDEDGWSNFAENRYNGWCQSTLAQLISHAEGGVEVLDAPRPAIKMTVRYNGARDLTKNVSGEASGSSGSGNNVSSDATAAPSLHVLAYTDAGMESPDAEFVVQPGTTIKSEVYLGGWENRVIRGTLQPGNIGYGDVDIKFAQLPQSDKYSWTDANGVQHISRPYSEFKEALAQDPNIIVNVTAFEWQQLNAASYGEATADRAVTVTSDGYIAVYGERVGKIDLLSGDFEFDMAAMANLSFDGFYKDSEANTWGVKEAVFKLEYTAKVPDTELYKVAVSLTQPAKGFVKGGKNSIFAYWDVDKDDAYTPGTDPCGVVRDVEIGWRGLSVEMDLEETSAITPRIKLWETASSDRAVRFYETPATNRFVAVDPAAMPPNIRVRVVRQVVDDQPIWNVSTDAEVVFDKTFTREVRDFIHEGDFLAGGKFDIDWDRLESEVYNNFDVRLAGLEVTNMTYVVVIGDGDIEYYSDIDDAHTVYAHPYTVTRRFEVDHTPPTAVSVNGDSICRVAQPTFRWRIDNEDPWASAYGTTYTAFKIKVRDLAGNEVYDSGYQRMPAADSTGVYSWTAPLYVGCPSPSGSHRVFNNLEDYTWQVFTYNAKFKTDDVGSVRQTFRMNVTEFDLSSYSTSVNVVYAGPATVSSAVGLIRVQAFESPDFTGRPVAEVVTSAPGVVKFIGLRPGTYFLRAYVDTDGDCALDDWESWGYLNERDHAAVSGTKSIFNPVSVTVGSEVKSESVRTIYIEDRDTDGDGFPDAWEAEQSGRVFNKEIVKPVTGDAEFVAVNTNLAAAISEVADKGQLDQLFLMTRGGKYGVSLMTGLSLSSIKTTSAGALRVASAVVGDSVAIKSLAIDRATGEVVLGVAAETEAGAIDPAVAALYSVEVGADVTVKVYRTESLAAEWQLVAEKSMTITAAGKEVRAPLPEGVDTTSGFFKVEIE